MNMSEPIRFATREQAQALRGELRLAVTMSRHTSWRAGGVADRVYQPADLADLCAFLRALPDGEPLLAVGLGSNLLVRDGGVRGTVLLMHGALRELSMQADGSIYAGAGVPGAKLARFAALHDLGGAEFFAGIPGTVGGMLAMNAGCYGGETWQHVERVQLVNRRGELLERTPAEYEVGYRSVKLREKGEEGRGKSGAVTEGEGFTLTPSPLSLPQEEFFVGAWLCFAPGDAEQSREQIKTLLAKRIASQPLNLPNAGSVFRNPPGDHAARLIEQCGLKGFRQGGAQVSEKHANFIVNVAEATAADIESLIALVRNTVLQQTGVDLHPEVRIIGEANKP
ncbi:MAG: UDP-N-acetylmuramate dehydrogenase [Gallionella sp.]|nr:UDP-N-acetylmuramate dehydrogenase [Gallionella sp.]MDD4946310.1 UDP-N-acetylmuramate dehydrogenase [Gallionella sp.]